MEMTFYEGTSLVISLIALGAATYKPIWNLIHKARLLVEPYAQILIMHGMGNPQINMSLILTNVGGHNLSINNIMLNLSYNDNPIPLKAQSFFKWGTNETPLYFSRLSLAAEKDWNNVVVFYTALSKADEDTTRTIARNLRRDIRGKIDERNRVNTQNTTLIEGDNRYVAAALEFFNNHNKWVQGEYRAELKFDCTPKHASCSYTFRFTLYETDANIIREYCENKYKYGFGVVQDFKDGDKPEIPSAEIQDFRLKG